jgi:hypothetical protein
LSFPWAGDLRLGPLDESNLGRDSCAANRKTVYI